MRWLEYYWDEEDTWFYFEVGDDLWVERQIELQGPERVPIAAASLAETPDATTDGLAAMQAYERRWGQVAEKPVDLAAPYVAIDRDAFDNLWRLARAYLETRA